MSDVPKFQLYGEGDPETEGRMQPNLALRSWLDLNLTERETFLQEMVNRRLIDPLSEKVLASVKHLNVTLLRELPAKRLHKSKGDDFTQRREAYADFQEIILKSTNEDIVLRMLSALASTFIETLTLQSARKEKDEEKRKSLVKFAYEKFDRVSVVLNYLFRQFAVNIQVTRIGFAPVQDPKIAEQIYVPALRALSDPKYARVSDDIDQMFSDYRAGRLGEVITKAHSAVQRFLQIEVGTEGKNAKGELKELFAAAKASGLVSSTRFGEPLIKALEGYFPSERATKSTAKPALSEAKPRDAMLMMDLVMVFIKHCLAA